MIGFFPYKSLYFECYATMPMFAGAHISSLGYLCSDELYESLVDFRANPSQISTGRHVFL